MKRVLLIAALLMGATAAFAQDYTPTTTWPYANADFAAGYITLSDGSVKTMLCNINLVQETLHFIDGEFIRETFDAVSVKIGDDTYMNAGGKMMKVLAANEDGAVLEDVTIDIATLNSTGGAYGSSSTTLGTMALSSLEGIGATNSSTALNHMELKAGKDSGQMLPLIKKKYLYVDGKRIYATKKDVGEAVGSDILKSFLKTHKVKWSNAESLLQLTPLIAGK